MRSTIEKQNKDLENTLIQISSTSSQEPTEPVSKSNSLTVSMRIFKTLNDKPYHYTQHDLFREVHYNQRGQKQLKIETYKLQRSELCGKLGWGIHGDEEGKLALVPFNSSEYRRLMADPLVRKKNAYNKP